MSDLPLLNDRPAFSVSELSAAIKSALEKGFGEVRVRGELGRVTKAASGHMYFDLKDASALINGVWFKGSQRRVPDMAEGLEVIVTGRLSTYPARSNYQLIVSAVEPAGIGALLKLIEERKKKLAAEGLFSEARKRPLPYLPKVIGIITSPTGAVIHDMLHRFRERFLPHVLVWPVQVQGEAAAAQVLTALKGFNALQPGGPVPRPDLLIIARGGGSVEDLMPFNDEALVRAVAASAIPVISAIGHETDWTLIDFAADLRAPTPTGAAEFAVPVKEDLLAVVADLSQRLQSAPRRLIREYRLRMTEVRPPRSLLENLTQRLDERSLRLQQAPLRLIREYRVRLGDVKPPLHLLQMLAQRLDDRSRRLSSGLQSWLHVRHLQLTRLQLRAPAAQVHRQQDRLSALQQRLSPDMVLRSVEPQRQKLQRLGEKLDLLSYERTLERGFAVVKDAEGRPVTRAAQAPADMRLRFADGELAVVKKPVS